VPLAPDFFCFAAPINFVLYGEHSARNCGIAHPVQPDLLQFGHCDSVSTGGGCEQEQYKLCNSISSI